MDTNSDGAAHELIHYQKYPVALWQDGFAAEHVNAPETVFRMLQEGQPRRPATAWIWSVMGGKSAPDYIFIDIDFKALLIC